MGGNNFLSQQSSLILRRQKTTPNFAFFCACMACSGFQSRPSRMTDESSSDTSDWKNRSIQSNSGRSHVIGRAIIIWLVTELMLRLISIFLSSFSFQSRVDYRIKYMPLVISTSSHITSSFLTAQHDAPPAASGRCVLCHHSFLCEKLVSEKTFGLRFAPQITPIEDVQ